MTTGIEEFFKDGNKIKNANIWESVLLYGARIIKFANEKTTVYRNGLLATIGKNIMTGKEN